MAAAPSTGDRRYIYQVAFDRSEGRWRGECAEFPGVSTDAFATPDEALESIITVVNDLYRRMIGAGQPTPEGIRQKDYSGNISLRTSPEHHAALVDLARHNNLSLNSFLQVQLTPAPWGAMPLDSLDT